MNVKVISRNPDEYMRDTKMGLHKMKRNYDPELHPMESARKLLLCTTNNQYKLNIALMSSLFRLQVNTCER